MCVNDFLSYVVFDSQHHILDVIKLQLQHYEQK